MLEFVALTFMLLFAAFWISEIQSVNVAENEVKSQHGKRLNIFFI